MKSKSTTFSSTDGEGSDADNMAFLGARIGRVLAGALVGITTAVAFTPTGAHAAVYWTRGTSCGPPYSCNQPGTEVARANLDGTGVIPGYIDNADSPCGVAVDSAHIYWTSS